MNLFSSIWIDFFDFVVENQGWFIAICAILGFFLAGYLLIGFTKRMHWITLGSAVTGPFAPVAYVLAIFGFYHKKISPRINISLTLIATSLVWFFVFLLPMSGTKVFFFFLCSMFSLVIVYWFLKKKNVDLWLFAWTSACLSYLLFIFIKSYLLQIQYGFSWEKLYLAFIIGYSSLYVIIHLMNLTLLILGGIMKEESLEKVHRGVKELLKSNFVHTRLFTYNAFLDVFIVIFVMAACFIVSSSHCVYLANSFIALALTVVQKRDLGML